jgi:hypothetical protein
VPRRISQAASIAAATPTSSVTSHIVVFILNPA